MTGQAVGKPLRRACRRTGFTLVECVTVCAVVGVLAAVAVPSYRGYQLRMGRIDAVAALTRVQAEQEKHRELHGLYAHELAALRGVLQTSPQRRYTLALAVTGPQGYRASATASGPQSQDTGCPTLTLEVNAGFPQHGPNAACWNH